MTNSVFADKIILVTGGTGTFGRAFVSRLLSIPEVRKVIVFSRDEFKQSQMQQELPRDEKRARFFLGDVRDLSRLGRAFQDVDIVVHAAALKQVPALEYNPMEAIKTNVVGTQNVIDAALDNNVEKVLLISSDKAVQPINLYGATKLCAEKLCIAANAYRGEHRRTRFSAARYGNVWGSRGSLVDLIQRQRPGGTVTLTDERMTRFLIPVDQIMGMILQVLTRMEGGEIFVPKMSSFRVVDVLKTLAPECHVRVIGARPGEKIHEVLITEYEAHRTKDAGEFYIITPESGKELEWVQKFPSFTASVSYSSDHAQYLRSLEVISQIFET